MAGSRTGLVMRVKGEMTSLNNHTYELVCFPSMHYTLAKFELKIYENKRDNVLSCFMHQFCHIPNTLQLPTPRTLER